MISRRQFLQSSMLAGAGLAVDRVDALARQLSARRTLKERFPDLGRHFIFEYYPWYGAAPFRHWDQDAHRPPADLAANYVPKLGAYDSASTKVMEQHAAWIKTSGAGAINVSWWGRDSDTDRLVPSLMDVMAAHDIRVTFHLEPYRDHHALAYASDVEYLVSKYGDARKWDCFLLLRHEDGATGPVFKSFRTILPATATDCHGRTSDIVDYTTDSVWREQTDLVRRTFASDFKRVTLLADSLDVGRTQAAGFDGIAIYDNYVRPNTWRTHAEACAARGLVFSFSVNPGFDGVVDPRLGPDECYVPPALEPGASTVDWSQAADRERAARESEHRIAESFEATISLQSDDRLSNAARGFFLVYLNSFNEWHEGHQFEPMQDAADLGAEERARGYHNPANGNYRMAELSKLLATVMEPR
jgi:Glycosyl hydrolase family 99